MTENFLAAFNLHPYGSPEVAFGKLTYAIAMRKDDKGGSLTEDYILSKWNQYINLCRQEERQGKYIKKMENFIEDGMYLGVYEFKDLKQTNIVDSWLNGL